MKKEPLLINYSTEELQLALPDQISQDMSINMLLFKDLGTSLVIGRGLLQEGEDLEQNYINQINKLHAQTQNFRYTQPLPVTVGINHDIEALEATNEFHRGKDQTFQYQLMFLLSNSNKTLALSYVKATPLGEKEKKHWELIKASIDLTKGTI